MPYNHDLAVRLSDITLKDNEIVLKKIFGGLGYMCKGNMALGIFGDGLILRCEKHEAESLLQLDGYEPFYNKTHTKPMSGWVICTGWQNMEEQALHSLVLAAVNFARALPPK